MRCRTLGTVLRARGHEVCILCRELPEALVRQLGADGILVVPLPGQQGAGPLAEKSDAAAFRAALGTSRSDWIVVDHYGLGLDWEMEVRHSTRRLMVIDDLANRPHDCDVLLDQNLVAGFELRYQQLVGENCKLLLGPGHALVAPEFPAHRSDSLSRRRAGERMRLLIFMGGGDTFKATAMALDAVAMSEPAWTSIDCVVGAGCPNLGDLRFRTGKIPGAALHVQTSRMADLMLAADCAITGGGSVSWEKCTMGLPSVVAVMAENQAPIAAALHSAGAQMTLGSVERLTSADVSSALARIRAEHLANMTSKCSAICDGLGAVRVAEALELNS